MKIILVFFIFFIVMLLESVYCRVASVHQIQSREHEEQKIKKDTKNSTMLSGIISKLYAFAGDFTFLSFKMVGYIPSHAIRKFLYKTVYRMELGRNSVIHYGLEARNPWNIKIGEGTIIGDHAIMDARYGIIIGSNVNLSSGVWIWTLQHDFNALDFGVAGQGNCVIIDDRAWISSRTSILPGCHILEGCVVACGAILTKSTNCKFGVYGGIPATYVCQRNNEINYEFSGRHRLFL